MSVTDVDLELSLVVDVSGSVDSGEFGLMMEGYAQAFEDAAIQSAISGGSVGAIAVNMVQFASSAAEVIPWTLIDGAASADAFSGIVRGTARDGSIGSSTGIGEGIAVSTGTFAGNSFESMRQVIDVSGDGDNNTGRVVADERDAALAGEVDTINGIVISDDASGSVLAHYRSEVIGGDKAFATSADDFDDFADKILAKINAEILGIPLPDESPGALPAVARGATALIVNGMFEDINGRLFRARAGFREPSEIAVAGSWSEPAPKGGFEESFAPPPSGKPWEAFGSIGLFYNEVEGLDANVAGGVQQLVPEYEMTLLHGTVGIEYDVDRNFSIGAALLGGTGEVEVDAPNADLDVDSLGVAVYGTYYRQDAFAGLGLPVPGDFWCDLLYGFQNTEFDGNAGVGSADADTHRVDFNTGVNFRTNQITHGPMAGISWVDGDVDSSGAAPTVDLESLVTTLGYQASYRMPTQMGDVVPQVRAAWEHEFEDDPVIAAGVNLGEPDSDKAVFGGGVLWQFSQDFYALLDYQARLGDAADSHNVLLRIGGFF